MDQGPQTRSGSLMIGGSDHLQRGSVSGFALGRSFCREAGPVVSSLRYPPAIIRSTDPTSVSKLYGLSMKPQAPALRASSSSA